MKTFFIILILIVATVVSGCNKQPINPNLKSITSYVACGCGCCGGEEPIEKCIYHSKGDDLNKIIEEDKKSAQSDQCALMGCSLGIKYVYCD